MSGGSGAFLLAIWLATLAPRQAAADAGELSLGATLQGQLNPAQPTLALALQAQADVGLSELFSARLQAGPVWSPTTGQVRADVGLATVLALDAVAWVPAAWVDVGWQGPHGGWRFGGGLELRRFFARQQAWLLQLGGRWRHGAAEILVAAGSTFAF